MEDLTSNMAEFLYRQSVKGVSRITGRALETEFASILLDCCLTWRPAPEETVRLSKPAAVDGIIGFAFGNRFEAHGNRSAGPVNERLASLVSQYFKVLVSVNPELHVWVQWEVGHYIPPSTIPAAQITKLDPVPNIDRDTVAYVSTIDVMKTACIALEAQGKKEGATLLVVAQPDHLRRCMKTVRSFRHQPLAADHQSPDSADWYDDQSGQLWTRTRHLYLLHDMIGQLNMHRDAAYREAKAAGLW